MKTILLPFLSLILFSCIQHATPKDNELTGYLKNISFSDNTEILGNWSMCSSSGNGMMTQFNVCPTISFLANGSGFVGSLPLSTNRFSWTFEKGKLNIFPNNKVSNATFSDTFYFAKIKTENNLRNLVISATKNDSQFFLSR